jgi:hypothetical protein
LQADICKAYHRVPRTGAETKGVVANAETAHAVVVSL